MPAHRYSGWPGAWCLDCGLPDPREEALAHGCLDFVCTVCGEHWPQGICKKANRDHFLLVEKFSCGQHGSDECLEPMSHNHDPYAH